VEADEIRDRRDPPRRPQREGIARGGAARGGRKFALAAQGYREILGRDPKHVIAWINLGNAETRLGRMVAAEEAFRKALEIQPDAADALNNLAWLLYEQKRVEEAEPIARKDATTKAPDA
jgi:Tfp pilus assembly protein PilF